MCRIRSARAASSAAPARPSRSASGSSCSRCGSSRRSSSSRSYTTRGCKVSDTARASTTDVCLAPGYDWCACLNVFLVHLLGRLLLQVLVLKCKYKYNLIICRELHNYQNALLNLVLITVINYTCVKSYPNRYPCSSRLAAEKHLNNF